MNYELTPVKKQEQLLWIFIKYREQKGAILQLQASAVLISFTDS